MQLTSVISRLQALSRRLLARIVLIGTSKLLVIGVALAVGTFVLDYFLRLPVGVRGVLLGLSLLTLGWVAVKSLIRPLCSKPSIDELALIAEKADPSLKDQLISSIQLERDLEAGTAVESKELIEATVADTAKRFANHSFASAVSLKPCAKPLGWALAALVALGAAGFSAPDTFGLWFKRQILLQDTPWPRAHTLEITIVDAEKYDPIEEDEGRRIILHVPERTSLQIQVSEKDGNLPDEVELVTRTLDADDGEQRISMGRTQKNPFFQHVFPALMRSVTFYAEGGDDDDQYPVYEIRVARAPRVTAFRADYDYPDYTGLENRTLPDANISAAEGTRILMRFEVNMPLDSFQLAFDSIGDITLEPREDGSFTHSFAVAGNDFYTFRLKGENGVASADAPKYVITAESDQAPRIAVEMPGSTSLLVSARAVIPLKGTATDDYGITQVGLRWGEDGEKLEDGSIDFQGEELVGGAQLGNRQVAFFRGLDVKSIMMPERKADGDIAGRPERPAADGDRFAFRYLAADNRSTAAHPEPHKVFGDYEYQVQVLSVEDLQRQFAQRQVRLRDRVQDIGNLIDARISDTQELLAAVRDASDDSIPQNRFFRVEQDQNRISIELGATARQFLKVYDGYLWNRIDEGALTERMMALLMTSYREAESNDSFQIYGDAVSKVAPLVDEGQVMGRLTVILQLMLRSAAERSPEAQRRLSRAGLITSKEDRIDTLMGALEIQRLLRDDIQLLIEKLEAWEDYLDVIQGFKDLLELQRGIHEGIEKLTKKK